MDAPVQYTVLAEIPATNPADAQKGESDLAGHLLRLGLLGLVAGAEVPAAMYRVLSDEIGESRGCHSYRKELEKEVAELPLAAATESVEPPLDLTN